MSTHHCKNVCEAKGCRKTAHLFFEHGAYWCKTHVRTIILIRDRINDHNGDIEELYARHAEIVLRKHTDPGHLAYYNRLNEKYTAAAYAQYYYAALNNYYQSFAYK